MRKVLKIASYDFKRIMLNPITIGFLVAVLVLCFVTGLVYKIPAAEKYSTQITAETTREFYEKFKDSDEADSKGQLDALLEKTLSYINLNSDSKDEKTLSEIQKNFEALKTNISRTQGGTLSSPDFLYSQIKSYTDQLKTFIEEFEKKNDFESNLIIYKKDFEQLKELSKYFSGVVESKTGERDVYQEFYKATSNFTKLDETIGNVEAWKVSEEQTKTLTETYYNVADNKAKAIFSKMTKIYESTSTNYDDESLDEMRNLATNYKLTCESARFGVLYEFRIILENHYGKAKNIQGYEDIYVEDMHITLAKINYFLQDENLEYTQYQEALNFNVASYEVSVFDYTYFMLSIVGFLTILFGMFLAYKFYGLDKRHGKIDILISQNATFNQIFTGQFLAIFYCTALCIVGFTLINFIWGILMYALLPGTMMAVFNLNSAYIISPFIFLLIKMIGIELQVLFYTIITIFIMSFSRKFELNLAIACIVFAAATVCNIFLNNIFVYCLLPFIHADLTSFLGGATMQSGFLRTALYSSGSFYISLAYYLVVVISLYTFTRQLFRKN